MANISTVPGLNEGQTNAADKFFEFLFSKRKEFGIKGPGGVGKSHLMSNMINEVMPRYLETCKLMGIEPLYHDVHMTAMTNKAAEVLAQFTGQEVSTVQSFMNLKVSDDYETGESKLIKTNAWKVHVGIILFIDECSMIDGQLDKVLQEGTHDCKIVYVGDDRQMAPVKESLSPIYRAGRVEWAELTQQMRTQVPEIQALHAQLRETVLTGIFKPIQIVPGIIDHLDDNQMQAKLAETFAQQTKDHRILAYTNKRVVLYNDYIREIRGLPHEYTIGEMLVNSAAIRLKNSMLSVEEEVEIIDLGQEQDMPIEDNVSMKVRLCTLKTARGVFRDIPIPSDRGHFAALLNYFRKNKNWQRYYGMRNTYPDLRQRDAATVYKAQGSTYDSCFVDLTDISTCHNPAQVARMLYVALSRERMHIYLYGNLADKYGGLIHALPI